MSKQENSTQDVFKNRSIVCIEILFYTLSHTIRNFFEGQKDIQDKIQGIKWAYSLTGLLLEILDIIDIDLNSFTENGNGRKCIKESSGYLLLTSNLKEFDHKCNELIFDSDNHIRIHGFSKNEASEFIHFLKLFFQRIDRIFQRIDQINLLNQEYDDLIDSKNIKRLVFGYEGGINSHFLIEFRVSHQLQEIEFSVVNILLKEAVDEIKSEDYVNAIKTIKNINTIGKFINSVLNVLTERLTMEDYHRFREDLGESSGIQSKIIKKKCFSKLYPIFSESILQTIKSYSSTNSEQENIRSIYNKKNEDPQSFYLSTIWEESIKVSYFLNEWREIHLHFPKNMLGGEYKNYGTSSMIGLKNGLEAVEKMKKAAERKDHILNLHRSLNKFNDETFQSNSRYSTSKKLVDLTGKITQMKFDKVQRKAHGVD